MQQKNIATASSVVNDYIESMKQVLKTKDFGKVGIVFTVHEGFVVGVQEIRETKMLINGCEENT